MIYRVITVCIFLLALAGLIGYARGYRIDIRSTEVSSRGLVAVTSTPRSAKILVNNTFKGVTDTSLYLSPGTYTITIIKDGYFPWSKTIKVQGEIVQSTDATLYPINSSLIPLTNIGILRAIPFGVDGKKVLIFSSMTSARQSDTLPVPLPSEEVGTPKQGIFVYDPRTQAVSIFPALTQIADYVVFRNDIQSSTYDVIFSPDFDQVVLFFNPKYSSESTSIVSQYDTGYTAPETFDAAYLLSLNELNTSPLDVTYSALSLIDAWSAQKSANVSSLLSGYHKKVQAFVESSAKIVDISPDKTRILYEATTTAVLEPVLKQPLIGVNQTKNVRVTEPQNLYVYDVREDRNYLVLSSSALERQHGYPLFHPNSKNIVLNEDSSISVMDYDGMNKQKLYSGPYDNTFFAVTSDGRILVLANFNPALNESFDLYAVGIR